MEHTTQHAINWFEIPVSNLDRAAAFYETLLASPLRRETMGTSQHGVFSYDETGVGGCLIAGSEVPAPATDGTLIYLNAKPSLDAVLARASPRRKCNCRAIWAASPTSPTPRATASACTRWLEQGHSC